ncbi:MAG: glycosyltransferase [Planctomycetota bacterium]|nr:glycosyltransferase [Planctomycetota bacterium]
MIEYDLVIATRNRPQALALSVPLLVQQSVLPKRLIIADSSDDPAPARRVVEESCAGAKIELLFLRCDRGLTRQRNAGLQHVQSPVVLFPDDDALAFPGVAEAILKVYDLDTAGDIGGVCSAWAHELPSGVVEKLTYVMPRSDRLKLAISRCRHLIENRLFPNPFIVHGRAQWHVRPVPTWLSREDVVQVEWMTGLCMSFRTELIRRLRFDETLEGYGLFEDVEASFKISHNHLIVGANNARLFHYRMPGRRGSGAEMGATQILNRAYVTCRHAPPGSRARRAVMRYAWYKLLLYALQSHSSFGRDRIRGAWRGLKASRKLLQASPDSLPDLYTELLRQAINHE